MESISNQKRMSDFKLDEESSKFGSSNSMKSQSSEINMSISDKDPFEKETLKTIDEMKRENENYLKDNKNPYDLDEKKNLAYIKEILESKQMNDQNKINAFNNIQYKLSYEDRHSLLVDYKMLFDKDEFIKKNPKVKIRQEEKLKKVFISLLNGIMKGKSTDIKNLFQTKYYVSDQSSKIPFLYGSEEYIFANLINDLYDTLIIKSNYPQKWNDKPFDEHKNLSNYINNKAIKPVMRPIKIIEKNNMDKMDIEDNIIKESDNKRHYLTQRKLIEKKLLLQPIFELYCSEEFQKKYEENLMKSPDKRAKYIYEIILESLFFYCLNFDEVKKKDIIGEYAKIFYECEKQKIKAFEENEFDLTKIKDSEDKSIDISKGLKNKIYKIEIGKVEFNLNFYDYNIKRLLPEIMKINFIPDNNKRQYLENLLDNCEYWTIQRYAVVNKIYNGDENLNKLFDNELDLMLKHKVLENVFDEVILFNKFQYPFLNEAFIKQVHDSVVYVKLPTKLIIGLTVKNMGIIIINKGRYSEIIDEQKNKNVKFALKLSEFSFYKVTLLHEINFHYFLVILYSNDQLNCLNTPEIVFKNYTIDEKEKCDFGDQGEVVLFGKKVSELFINGIISIITLDLWNNNMNEKPSNIGIKFLKLNQEQLNTGNFTVKNLIRLSKFTEYLYEKIKNENDLEPFVLNSDIGDFFSRGKLLDVNIDEFNLEGKNFATIFPRGECLNVYRYYI